MATSTTPKTIDLRRFVTPQTITLADGTEHTPVFTAAVAELYREVQNIAVALQNGTLDNALAAQDTIDACLKLAYPTATPDQIAQTFKTYTDLKLTALAAAAGRVDAMIAELERLNPKAPGSEEAPPSPPATTSAP